MTWLAHWMGLDNASGPVYLFWSGIAGDLAYLGAVAALLRHVNCHEKGCPRIAIHHHPLTGVKSCRKHLAAAE